MSFEEILYRIREEDKKFAKQKKRNFIVPKYSPKKYYLDIASSKYFVALIQIRDHLKEVTDYYFRYVVKAKNVDLFMLTSSVSSPMGPGSDSEAIDIKFGKLITSLVDSSQFGFEPLLLNDIDRAYCYMPSMRGENPNKRHLNQFFHCEIEIKGSLEELKKIASGYIKIISQSILEAKNIINLISVDPKKTRAHLKELINQEEFLNISFDEAIDILEKAGKKKYINYTNKGRDISAKGEIELLKLLNVKTPIWVNNYDRDRTPFYQKPDINNEDKVINADLLVPPILKNSFGGEVLGSGQRQDNVKEMHESILRQGVNPNPYKWYINLRKQQNYQMTSGFGMGVERFIAWSLGLDNIRDAIIYPRLKNIKTYP